MKPRNHRRAIVAFFLYVTALLAVPSPARAEDIDIFTINPTVSGQRPNVLIILDSSSNWASTDSIAGGKKYQHVAAAMVSTIGNLTDQFNVGLMMMAETGNPNDNVDGGVMRAGIRQMTAANKGKIVDFFANVDGDFDKSNNTSMGMSFYEAYLYFTGQTGFGGIGKAKRDYGGNDWANAGASQQGAPAPMIAAVNALYNTTPNALTSVGSTAYNSPMTDACQKNFIIYIANGPVSDPNSSNSTATTKLSDVAGAGATETIPLNPSGDQANISDEWTKWLANNDVSSGFPGKQVIVTYTVEVNPVANTQGLNNSALLASVGNKNTGNGGYFPVTSAGGGAQIADALNQIFAEILAVNSVFASSTLPVSVNVRGAFLNQVYMGVFRPDGNSSPRWPGNVKQFTLAADSSGNVFLVDKNGVGIENPNNGFIADSAVSFWSTASTFWNNVYYPDTVAQAPLTPTTSDIPDGGFVEKGGAAQHLRDDHATDVTTRKVYTCIGCAVDAILSDGTNNFDTANTGVTDALLGITGARTVSSLTRSGNTVTATSTAHGFTNGQSVTIAGANEAGYNVLTNATVVDANTFTYSITELPASPATAASGQTLTAAKGTSAQSVSSITLSGTTATVTTPVDHLLANGASVTISGDISTQAEYTGTFTIAVTSATTFTYTVTVGPSNPTTPGNITVTRSDGSTATSAISSMTRSGTTVSVGTSSNVFTGALTCSSVTITAAVPTNYNVAGRTPCTKVGNKALTFDFTAGELTPTSPALGTITADASVTRTISSMTRPTGSGTVTVTTSAAHPFLNGDTITISGASDSLYNGNQIIAGVTATTFTFTVTPQPVSPASGSIVATGSASVARDPLINWVRGQNVKVDDNPTPTATHVRGYLHGDVLHSRPAVVNYARAAQPVNRDLVVYYGGNDGMIHAVKGGQNDADGDHKWGFIPTEFYPGFARLYNESPIISTNNPRTYFADGPISVDTVTNADLSTTPATERIEGVGARAQIFVGMRRGGRFYYSLDVTSPDAPKFKWKITNSTTGFAELGQSWSEAKVSKVKLEPAKCPGGGTAIPGDAVNVSCKVLIFGGGYDSAANDPDIQGTATMGRAIYVVDAIDGTLIWSAGAAASGGVHINVPGMDFAIPADLAVINSDLDVNGLSDRIYAADTGANIWRANISDPDPANWAVGKLASLGGSGVDARKFLFAPDVVAFDSTTDSVLVGSGDREKPFDTTIANRYYMIKDSHALTALPAAVITEANLVDLTSNALQDPATSQTTLDQINSDLAAGSGWFIRLGTGEKTVTGATTLGGTTIFATNTPASVSTPGSCTGSLGLALIYGVDFKNATATIDFNGDGVLSGSERNIERTGGGFPPTAIPFATQIGNDYFEGAITGTQVIQPPSSPVGQRYRVFWNLQVDN
jgi:type IV pilus assembly protein PilY1